MDHAGPFDREHRESRNRRRGRNRLGGNEQRAVELRQHHARRGPRDRTRRLHQGRGAGRLRLRHHRNAVQQAGRQQEDAAGEYAAAGFARRRQDPDDAGQRQQTAWLENQHRRLHRNAQILRRPQPVGEITDKTEIGKFILRVDNSKLVYDTKLATVDFRAQAFPAT